ncbi:MAG: copper chaperone PCu(A)C [Pseudomonadota bacterium]|uniref:copper chaperone PCu(A)C n=1 Tax=Roseovarius TaxID=74030 RepID=UPI0022A83B7D|nr:copper chaperone PCu(A)C [Roseovarius sp. EGI FJ00037]MCZ0813248.1 copper chaperone PCu(A)C [Roseovarius sp. EGI FJ00037]
MSFKTTIAAAFAATALAFPAFAQDITVNDPYARSSAMMATSGAAFMTITNNSGTDDRLIAAASPVSAKVELHTHKEDENGVMRMIHVEEGMPIAAGETLMLERGGNHVMFMGIETPFEQGAAIPLTLTFESAGEIAVEVPVDLER